MNDYIDQSLILSFENKQGSFFDYTKLLALLKGLNLVYKAKNPYLSAIVIRAILDHIPPLLGCNSFEMVANNYSWSPTNKSYMEKLLDFKNEGDDSLHTQISEKRDFLEIGNLPPGNRLNVLLQECLKKGTNEDLEKAKMINLSKTKIASEAKINITLVEARSWQNYVSGHLMGYSYSFVLDIDNYKSNKPDYVTAVRLEANSNDGLWETKNFIFDVANESEMNQPLRIEAWDVKKVAVLVSDGLFKHMTGEHRFKPNIDEDTMLLHISTKSDKKFIIKIKPGTLN